MRHTWFVAVALSIAVVAPCAGSDGGARRDIEATTWSPAANGHLGPATNRRVTLPRDWVADSLIAIVYRSRRMSTALRHSFERQVIRNGLRSSPGGQGAWVRVQRLDESLARLRSETGYVPQSAMQKCVIDVLEPARQVANSFNRHPNLRQLVSGEWDALQSELNELARYCGEPGIREPRGLAPLVAASRLGRTR